MSFDGERAEEGATISGDSPTVLVTGAGGGVGQSIIKCFEGSQYRVVALDCDPHAAGLYAAARGRIVPRATDPSYVDALIEIARDEQASIVFPGIENELFVLTEARPKLEAIGVTVVVSDPYAVSIADDKLATARFLAEAGLAAPRTEPLTTGSSPGVEPPLVLKPRKGGARSKGVYIVGDQAAATRALESIDPADYVAQEYLDGPEFTCGIVCLGGVCTDPIVMRRSLRDGDTYKAFVIRDARIETTVRKAALALLPFGACNFQLRLVEDQAYIFEINARCSGTTGARALAGFNEPRMIADWLSFGHRPRPEIREVAILRYWDELVVPLERIAETEDRGATEGDGMVLWRR